MYLDTSVVIPLYYPEALSQVVELQVEGETFLGISRLVEVEFHSALARRVRMGELAEHVAIAIANRFQMDVDAERYTRFALQPVHYDLACNSLKRFNTPLRTLDALHLAIARADGLQLITADDALATSAQILDVKCQLLKPSQISEEG
ncbi:MAG: type II toxin-antitoxin system VapC family toxin [Elainellaceae cyanobacterium]